MPKADAVAAGLFLRTDGPVENVRWLLLKATKHGEWGFPKGHQDTGETLVATALRECVEECGIAVVALDGKAYWNTYDLPSGRRKVTVYLPAVTSTLIVTLSSEHNDYGWFTREEVVRRLPHPSQRPLFRRHVEEDLGC
jgi:8-oxo-dGTP pyrophosphatase MutT (NUDIX family)